MAVKSEQTHKPKRGRRIIGTIDGPIEFHRSPYADIIEKAPVKSQPKRGRRRYAYRGGAMTEITGEIENPPRYPRLNFNGRGDRHWNRP